MSAKQANKKLSITLAVLGVMLVGVVALNISTFGGVGRAGGSARGYRLQAHPPVPSDMGRMIKYAVDSQEPERSLRTGPMITTLDRDPFFPGKDQPKPVLNTGSGFRKGATKPSAGIRPLECTAIMLGGNRPMAIINGEGRYPGDKIRGMILKEVDADGVTFTKSDDSIIRLPVGVAEVENQNYRVVTRTRELDDQGCTSLVNQ